MDTNKLVAKVEKFFDLSQKKRKKKHEKFMKIVRKLEKKKSRLIAELEAGASGDGDSERTHDLKQELHVVEKLIGKAKKIDLDN